MKLSKKNIIIYAIIFVFVVISTAITLTLVASNTEETNLSPLELTVKQAQNEVSNGNTDKAKRILSDALDDYQKQSDANSASEIEYQLFLIDYPDPEPVNEEDAKFSD